jgi:hypothetical protein
MEIKAIRERLDALAAGMLAKGLVDPSADLTVRSDVSGVSVALSWRGKPNTSMPNYKFFHGEPVIALDAAAAHVAALPSPEETRMKAFMLSLSETIELGKKVDTEVDFINPLVVLMEKLSKNALTGPVA